MIEVYGLAFFEGILTFISPCVLPLIPVYFIYLAGTNTEGTLEQKDKNKARLLINSLGFVLGFTILFTVLGASATFIGGFLSKNQDILRKVTSIIIIIFGLFYTGVLNIGFLSKERRLNYKFDNLKFWGSIVLGMVFGFSWTQCTGPILGIVLAQAANLETMASGIALLLVYSAGIGLPFIISALMFESLQGAFNFLKKHSNKIKMVSGIILILFGIAMFFDLIKFNF
ncbi:cytochrome c biogenesis CcdA family protein [Herbivorax sp. ANBcel31]|uniref:cytochrome c biogenesis CcdA family protein n=1 Tax=Herbivorax sp. ANBcel31 TaxID=3069754 RepID=UPI0027B29197|nr:cytochrome c biogenesis CcdA family protein [Herbivorax sp. ANBcel31]MDQ2084955.1 cytochrome c biogenesis CcdA family protein [Herbivorax sp. ANBcel31]